MTICYANKKIILFLSLQAALEIGLRVEEVKRALKKRIEETGGPHDNADQLIADVLRNQAMDEDSRYVKIKNIHFPNVLEITIRI